MHKRTLTTRIVLLLALILVGCSPANPPSAATQAPPPAAKTEPTQPPKPIVLGLLTPLSPPGDPVGGKLMQRGAELAAEYVNTQMGGALDGRPVKIAVEDDQGTPEVGVAGYRRLVIDQGAVAVLGQFHSSVNLAVNEVAKEIGVPVFATQTSHQDITGKHYDIAFRTHAIDPLKAKAWMGFAQKKGFKRLAMIAENTDYGTGLVEEMKRLTKETGQGMELLPIVFAQGLVDLTPQLLQIKAWKPDLVINVGVGQAQDLIQDQATTIDLFPEVPMVTHNDYAVRADYWKLHKDNGVDLYFISNYHPSAQLTPSGKWFTTQYQAKYNEAAVYTAYSAFGNVVVIAQALRQTGTTEAKALIKALETGKFTSWNGEVTFPRGDGPHWHQASPPILILHYTKANQPYQEAEIVYP